MPYYIKYERSFNNWMTEEEYNFLNTWDTSHDKVEKWYRNKMRTLRTEGTHMNNSFKMYKKLNTQIMRMDEQASNEYFQLDNEIKKLKKSNDFLKYLVKKLGKK